MIGKLYQEFKQKIDNLILEIKKHPINSKIYLSEDFKKIIHKLEQLAVDEKYDILSNEILNSNYFKEKFQILRNTFDLYEVFLETKEYLQALNENHIIESDQIKRTFEFAKIEAERSGINKDSKVLFVGSGPFPETAIAIKSKFQCYVECIDLNPEAVSLSQTLIDKNNLGIIVFYGDGTKWDYKDYTHIFIAALAKPKREMLLRVCESSKKKVVLVIRTCRGIRTMIYEQVNDFLLEDYNIIDKIQGNTIMESIVLEHEPHS